MKLILIVYFIFSLSSCSILRKNKQFRQIDFPQLSEKVYEQSLRKHFASFRKNYADKEIKLKKSEKQYLERMVNSLIRDNSSFFEEIIKLKKINFYVFQSTEAYFFSIPGEGIILSSEVLSEYIENEDVLASLVLFEMVRMEHRLYPKKQKVALGITTDKDIIHMTQIQKMETRLRVHEWSYRLMRRTQFDPGTYLLWQQIMIRNSRKFEKHLDDYKDLSREERRLKAFVISIEKEDDHLNKNLDDKNIRKKRKTPRTFYELTERLDV